MSFFRLFGRLLGHWWIIWGSRGLFLGVLGAILARIWILLNSLGPFLAFPGRPELYGSAFLRFWDYMSDSVFVPGVAKAAPDGERWHLHELKVHKNNGVYSVFCTSPFSSLLCVFWGLSWCQLGLSRGLFRH